MDLQYNYDIFDVIFYLKKLLSLTGYWDIKLPISTSFNLFISNNNNGYLVISSYPLIILILKLHSFSMGWLVLFPEGMVTLEGLYMNLGNSMGRTCSIYFLIYCKMKFCSESFCWPIVSDRYSYGNIIKHKHSFTLWKFINI